MHIILHEIGHMLAQHAGTISVSRTDLEQIAPHLQPELITSILGRSAYSAAEEQEAEMIADLIWSATNDDLAVRQGDSARRANSRISEVFGR